LLFNIHTTSSPSSTIFFSILHPLPISTLFPYTTLFRSIVFGGPSLHLAHLRHPSGLDFRGPVRRGDLHALLDDPANKPGCVLITDRKSTRLNSSHVKISYAVFCLKKKTNLIYDTNPPES